MFSFGAGWARVGEGWTDLHFFIPPALRRHVTNPPLPRGVSDP